MQRLAGEPLTLEEQKWVGGQPGKSRGVLRVGGGVWPSSSAQGKGPFSAGLPPNRGEGALRCCSQPLLCFVCF